MERFLSLLEKYSKYIIAAVLIVVPLYPKFPFLRIPGTYVSIRLEDFLLGILAVVVLFKILPNIKSLMKDKISSAIFLFLLVGFVSLLSGVLITNTVVIHIGLLHFLRRIEYFIPFFAGYLIFRGKTDFRNSLEFFVKCLVIVVITSFIYGFGQRYFGWPVIVTQNEEYSKGIALRWIPGSHINSTFAGHYDLASFLVLTLPILITAFFTLDGRWTKFILGTSSFLGLWLLANTVSRISVVSYLMSVSLALIFVKKYKALLITLLISFAVFILTSSLLGRYAGLKNIFSFKTSIVLAQSESTVIEKKVTRTPKPSSVPIFEDRSTSIRLKVEWPRAIRAFAKNPLLGTGYSSITLATDNDFLRLIGEVGTLGLLAFTLVLFRIVAVLMKSFPINQKFSGIEIPFMAGTIAALPGVFLNSLFIDVFEASKFAIIFWLLVGLALSLVKERLYE